MEVLYSVHLPCTNLCTERVGILICTLCMYSMRMHCIYRGEYSRLLVTDNGYGVPHCTADIAPAAPAAPAADAG